jgi:hypothetical protein
MGLTTCWGRMNAREKPCLGTIYSTIGANSIGQSVPRVADNPVGLTAAALPHPAGGGTAAHHAFLGAWGPSAPRCVRGGAHGESGSEQCAVVWRGPLGARSGARPIARWGAERPQAPPRPARRGGMGARAERRIPSHRVAAESPSPAPARAGRGSRLGASRAWTAPHDLCFRIHHAGPAPLVPHVQSDRDCRNTHRHFTPALRYLFHRQPPCLLVHLRPSRVSFPTADPTRILRREVGLLV